jgi:RNA polymerase sigma-70 factor, ECF subfamily
MSLVEFETFFNRYYTPLCARISLIVFDRDLAEDLVQEAFVKFWNTNPDLSNPAAAPAYVSQIAVNNALMYLRKKHREEREQKEYKAVLPLTVNATEEEIYSADTARSIQEALQKLPPGCRRVFVLSRYEEMSYKEIASHLGISLKTVENQIGTALKILRTALQNLALALLFNFFL